MEPQTITLVCKFMIFWKVMNPSQTQFLKSSSQNGLSAIFDIFRVRALSYKTK